MKVDAGVVAPPHAHDKLEQVLVLEGDFFLATDAERSLIEQMRPPSDAPFASRVMFAVVLQQLGLRDAAVALWKTLLAERGDDPKLCQLVAQ